MAKRKVENLFSLRSSLAEASSGLSAVFEISEGQSNVSITILYSHRTSSSG